MGYTKTEKESAVDTLAGEHCTLLLYNDDVHTFQQVIKALIRICGHSPEQAEQCTLLVHYRGKCDVKHGGRTRLLPMLTALEAKGLTAEIAD